VCHLEQQNGARNCCQFQDGTPHQVQSKHESKHTYGKVLPTGLPTVTVPEEIKLPVPSRFEKELYETPTSTLFEMDPL